MAGMTEDQLKDYAKYLIEDHARDVEYLSIHEMYEQYADEDDAEISDDDAKKIDRLISQAIVTVTFPTP